MVIFKPDFLEPYNRPLHLTGTTIKTITGEELSKLPKQHLQLIKTYENSMERYYRYWSSVYDEKDASPDPLRNAQIDEQLTQLLKKMRQELLNILSFLESLGIELDDHYMHIRHLIQNLETKQGI